LWQGNNNLEKDLKMMGKKWVNVECPNAWWRSRNLKPWEFKSKADGLPAAFFYLISMPASDLPGPDPSGELEKQVSLCITWFSSPALSCRNYCCLSNRTWTKPPEFCPFDQ